MVPKRRSVSFFTVFLNNDVYIKYKKTNKTKTTTINSTGPISTLFVQVANQNLTTNNKQKNHNKLIPKAPQISQILRADHNTENHFSDEFEKFF